MGHVLFNSTVTSSKGFMNIKSPELICVCWIMSSFVENALLVWKTTHSFRGQCPFSNFLLIQNILPRGATFTNPTKHNISWFYNCFTLPSYRCISSSNMLLIRNWFFIIFVSTVELIPIDIAPTCKLWLTWYYINFSTILPEVLSFVNQNPLNL